VRSLKTPDVTKAQMMAVAAAIVGVFAAVGAPLSEANANRVYGAAIVLAIVLPIVDAVIRVGRAVMMGKKVTLEDLGLDDGEE
jgi:hypothetical protein